MAAVFVRMAFIIAVSLSLVMFAANGADPGHILSCAHAAPAGEKPWVDARSHASFSAALAAIGSAPATLLISERQQISVSTTVPSNVGLLFLAGGSLDLAAGVTATINGPLQVGLFRVFGGEGAVVLGPGSVVEVHPEWFGAKPDGAQDSGPAIQKCIDASPAGTVVRFAGGTYLTSVPIAFRPDRSYIGSSHSGSGTVIKQKDAARIAPAIFVSKGWTDGASIADNRVIFRDLLLHGNKKNNPNAATHGILSMNYYSVFENITVYDAPGDGIRFTDRNGANRVIASTAVGNKVLHGKFIKCGGSGIRGDNNGSALTDGYLIDNEIGNCGEHGISIERGAGWKVLGNYVYGVGRNGIVLDRGWNSQILGNTIDNYGLSAIKGTYAGLAMNTISDNVPCLINDNIIRLRDPAEGSTYRGITVTTGAGTKEAEVIIAGNIASLAKRGTFFVSGGNGGGTAQLSDNRVSGALATIARTGGSMVIVHRDNSFDIAFARFPGNDPTPSVLSGSQYRTINTAPTVISGFDDGYDGQRIVVVVDDAFTAMDFTGSQLSGNGGVDWKPRRGDHMECVFDGSAWHCMTSGRPR
jgi:hypothetical protein